MLQNLFRQRQRSNTGSYGENLAVSYLLTQHFRIVERNFKASYGEIDIVARDGETLVFVEVKTRTTKAYGSPLEAVTPRKLREVVQAAHYYRLRHPSRLGMRIDVIGIELDAETNSLRSLRHVRNVTQ